MEQYLKNFKNCLQKEIPFCAAECPFQFDILDFIEKMKRGSFKGAFKAYRNAVGFPLIASNLCTEPCKNVCPRNDSDGAVALGMLEKACISFTEDRSPTDYNLPMKRKKVAVIGAGISGLACALRLCMKKYEVEIFEETDRMGGYLWDLMDPGIFLKDIEDQFKHEKYVLHFNTKIQSVEAVASLGFDAAYAATGESGEDFGLLSSGCAQYGEAGWFAGGGLVGEEPIDALASGLHMGTVIDNFLKTGNLICPDNSRKTAMCLNPEKLKYEEPIIAKDGKHYSEEEARMEAARCVECQCDFCRTYCDLTEFYNKWPLRIRDEVLATTLPGSAEVKATPAKRLMSTCNQCGLCKETCPEEIDLGGLILEGRKSMHRQKKAPWVFHDFWLRDMDFAGSDLAALSKASPGAASGNEKCTYAFFPGCQLGASDPELVERAYDYLLGKRPDTGLILRCCGAPAEWSGNEEKHHEELEKIRSLWTDLGQPSLILACPTCEKKFKTYLTEILVISLYEVMADWGVNPPQHLKVTDDLNPADHLRRSVCHSSASKKVYSVFDACAARDEKKMRESVRMLAETAGYCLEPLLENDAHPRCCSFGGQPSIANPEYAEFVTKKRISESQNPYITYCINCRDVFADAGKEAVHILDLLLGDGKSPQKLVTVSQRRENRIKLKKALLKKHWDTVEMEEKERWNTMVNISSELKEKLSRDRILEEDVLAVLEFCERTGRRIYHAEKGTYSGYREIGYGTCWVEYKAKSEEGGYELINAYAHRMKIELEPVWNGRKTEHFS